MQSLQHVRIVLVEPQHPGNIGATARAMRTMGLTRLVLVAPRTFPHADASAMAAGADVVLERAAVVADLDAAIGDCRLVLGCTARARGVRLPELDPGEAARQLVAADDPGACALLFGRERTGLTNAELQRCHAAVRIPADPTFGSLNLAAAVQVLAYALRVAALAAAPGPAAARGDEPAATDAEMEGLFGHLESTLQRIDFFKGRSPDTIMRRLRRLFLRAQPSRREVLILRGILSEAQRSAVAGPAAAGDS